MNNNQLFEKSLIFLFIFQGKHSILKMPFQEEMQVLWDCHWLFIMECMRMLAGKLISLSTGDLDGSLIPSSTSSAKWGAR